MNTGSLLERLNFGLALSANRVRGTTVDMKSVAAGIESAKSEQVMERAIAVLLNGEVSQQTRAVLDRQLKEGVPVKGELDKAAANQTDAMNGGQMIAEGGLPSRPGQGAGRGARRAERYGFLNLRSHTARNARRPGSRQSIRPGARLAGIPTQIVGSRQ